ncbi:hypothetical protein Ami103574_04690 [Aminipila butyrica]|uniref:Phospholipase D-like domain-containing protein n=1 Tax=Aminipila butyrica TaxID=433296 RepID=A0A858BTY8_9FIRM|nr:phospholipase D family protein [Aminipila butyrica]QIB68659.1 hypothetical protein Ami103574_04690 [Aminipila butyrica]
MFDIQDPRYPNSRLLNEALLEACQPAIYGAGTYAFVSADGVRLLMDNPIFEQFMEDGTYHLIAGLDDITNLRTLAALKEYGDQFPQMRAEAFLHPTTGSTFHPKYSWFRYPRGGVLVLGSGNLTAKGLRRNTEAFVVQKLDEMEMQRVEQKWIDWLHYSRPYLKALNSPEVIAKAGENGRRAEEKTSANSFADGHQSAPGGLSASTPVNWDSEQGAWSFDSDSPVLVAECQPGANGTYQLNVDAALAKAFFGTATGPLEYMVWREVTDAGTLGDIRWQPDGMTSHKICQIELPPCRYRIKAAEKELPFAVFVRLAPRTLLYAVLLPGNRGYKQLLRQSNRAPRDEAGRILYTSNGGQLKEQLNALALLRYLRPPEGPCN